MKFVLNNSGFLKLTLTYLFCLYPNSVEATLLVETLQAATVMWRGPCFAQLIQAMSKHKELSRTSGLVNLANFNGTLPLTKLQALSFRSHVALLPRGSFFGA